jgi:hypothetical protein
MFNNKKYIGIKSITEIIVRYEEDERILKIYNYALINYQNEECFKIQEVWVCTIDMFQSWKLKENEISIIEYLY